jgi:hypothetical protein
MIGHASIYSQAQLAALLLDLYPSHSAWGLSKLRTEYSGSAIRIRRSSDNAETDIGFNEVDLDTAAISSFVGSNSAFVTTIYDQVGSKNFTQATEGNQPRIVNAGTLETDNGKPAIRFVANLHFMDVPSSTALFNFLHDGTKHFISVVCKAGLVADPNVFYIIFSTNTGVTSTIGTLFGYDDRAAVSRNNAINHNLTNGATTSISSIVNNVWTPNEQKLISLRGDPSNATAANRSLVNINSGSDNGNNSLTNAVSASNASNDLRLGRLSGSTTFPLNGTLQQLVFWDSDQSANRAAIEDLINDYYGIF